MDDHTLLRNTREVAWQAELGILGLASAIAEVATLPVGPNTDEATIRQIQRCWQALHRIELAPLVEEMARVKTAAYALRDRLESHQTCHVVRDKIIRPRRRPSSKSWHVAPQPD